MDSEHVLAMRVNNTVIIPAAERSHRRYSKRDEKPCIRCGNATNEIQLVCAVCLILRPGEHTALREEFAEDNARYPIHSMK